MGILSFGGYVTPDIMANQVGAAAETLRQARDKAFRRTFYDRELFRMDYVEEKFN